MHCALLQLPPSSLEDVWWRKAGETHLRAHLQVLEAFLENVIRDTVTSTQRAKRKTIGARDMFRTVKHPAPTILRFRG